MEPTNSPLSSVLPPVQSSPAGGITKKSFPLPLGFLLIVILGAWIVWQHLYQPRLVTSTSLEGSKILEDTTMQPNDFKPGKYQTYIATINVNVTNPTFSQDLKNHLLLKKGLMLLDAEETNPDIQIKNRKDANDIFTSVYNTPVNTEADAYYKEMSVEYLLLNYIRTIFAVRNTIQLPAAYKVDYQKVLAGTYESTDEKNHILQKESFKAYIALANDPSLSTLNKDKVMISMRLFTTASYLDGFYDSLSVEERQHLLEQLKRDISEYPNTQGIAFVDPRYTKLIADFYYAYAYDVLSSRSPVGTFVESEVAANYEKARANVTTKNEYANVYAIYGSYIDTYYIAHLATLYINEGTVKAKVDELADEMRGHLTLSPTVRNSVANLYSYLYSSLNGRGKWAGVSMRLEKFTTKNEAFKVFYKELTATSSLVSTVK